PSRIVWSGSPGQEGVLLVGIEGSVPAAESAAERVVSALADQGLWGQALAQDDADRVWSDHEAQVTGAEGETVLGVNGLPSELAILAEVVHHGAGEARVAARMASWAGQGMHTICFDEGEPAQHAEAVRQVRAYADRAGCSTMLHRRRDQVDRHLEVMGTPPSAVGVLRAIKAQFDPDHRLAPGRFAGWYEQPPTRPASAGRGTA
ncbi:MAG: FAD-linked oxidase C-terminal domain-containing protein, partial [Ornithinimicrobium sp.]